MLEGEILVREGKLTDGAGGAAGGGGEGGRSCGTTSRRTGSSRCGTRSGRSLLKAGQPAEAEAVYREDLRRWPDNGWSLFGLAAQPGGPGQDGRGGRGAGAVRRGVEAGGREAVVVVLLPAGRVVMGRTACVGDGSMNALLTPGSEIYREGTVELPGRALHYVECGAGRPVVLLHGYTIP